MNQRPPRAARPRRQPPGRSAEPSRDPVARCPGHQPAPLLGHSLAPVGSLASLGSHRSQQDQVLQEVVIILLHHAAPGARVQLAACGDTASPVHTCAAPPARAESEGEAFPSVHTTSEGESRPVHPPRLPTGHGHHPPTHSCRQVRTPQGSNGSLLRQRPGEGRRAAHPPQQIRRRQQEPAPGRQTAEKTAFGCSGAEAQGRSVTLEHGEQTIPSQKQDSSTQAAHSRTAAGPASLRQGRHCYMKDKTIWGKDKPVNHLYRQNQL